MKVFFILILLFGCATEFHSESSSDKIHFLRNRNYQKNQPSRHLAESSANTPAWLAFKGIDVQSYSVSIKANSLSDAELSASVRIELMSDPTLSELRFHVERGGIEILSARADQIEVPFHFIDLEGNQNGLAGEAVSIHVLPKSAHVIEFTYKIKVASQADSGGFFYVANYQGTPVLSTRSWPYFARSWMPSHDHPSDQARFTFELEGPLGFEVLASGRLVSKTLHEGRVRARFELAHKIPTYAANIVFGKFQSYPFDVCFDPALPTLKSNDCDQGASKLRFMVYLPPALGLENDLKASILKSADSLAWLSSSLGIYEFGSDLGIIVAPHPFSMEHVGLITLIEPGAAVHEVVHQWFGNSIAIAHWGEFWISEGFTTYLTGYYDELLNGTNTSCKKSSGILNNPETVDPMDIFDDVAYCKGAAALDALRTEFALIAEVPKGSEIERSAFSSLLKSLYSDYRLKPLSSALLHDWLKENSEKVYADKGLSMNALQLESALLSWIKNWFHPQP